MTTDTEYDLGYGDGWEAGMKAGVSEGYETAYEQCAVDYEERLAKYWAELQTLNARISFLDAELGRLNEEER